MTECERIVKEGILPDSFFEEEVRNDFLVTRERKKIWAIELDLLLQFDKICRIHNLKYWITGGTLLGAIRHNGFIPWDDDMDVEMPREDYEKLLKLHAVFNPPYFLQNPRTDKYYAFSHSRLINLNTTAFSKVFAFHPMKAGIFIDVFPVDNWVEHDTESVKRINQLNIDNSTYMRLTNPYLDEKNKKRVESWPGVDSLKVYNEIQKIATQYNETKTTYQRRIVITGNSRFFLFYAQDFEHVKLHSFEGFLFPIPCGYMRILETQYGDYMKMPPIEQRGTLHSSIIFCPDEPFDLYLQRYMNQMKEGMNF